MESHDDGSRVKRTYTVIGITGAVVVAIALYFSLIGGNGVETTNASIETASLPPLAAKEIHSGLDYSLAEVADQKLAPRVFVKSVRVDLGRIRDVDEKKATFFKILLPIIARESDRIRAEREEIIKDPEAISASLYEKYDVEVGDVDTLLKHVDIVPASLILAQAALESGWGSSRFARRGNNYFGMRTYDPDVPGIEPTDAEGFKVMTFKNLSHGVRVYIANLNTHGAYKKLREARAKMRADGEAPAGRPLTHYLTSYSEIPGKYEKRLRAMIDQNGLSRYDGVRLAS